MNRHRVRAYLIVVATVFWSLWAINVSTRGPLDRVGKAKGTDFIQFYTAGSLLRDRQAGNLYDVRATHGRMQRVAPGGRDLVYVPIQSPQLAIAFAPLAALPYATAWWLWSAALAALYAIACWMLWRECAPLHAYRIETIAAGIALPAFYSTVLHGQASAVALLLVVSAMAALRRGAALSAGLALGSLVFKPHWVAAAGVVFLAAREWRVAAGLAASAIAQLAATFLLVGSHVMAAYWRTLWSVQRVGDLLEPRPSYSLRGLSVMLVDSDRAAMAVYACAAAGVVAMAVRVWRSDEAFEMRASAVLLTVVAISPHVLEYDLLLLAPVYAMLAGRILQSPADPASRVIGWSLCASFFAPVLTAAPAMIRVPLAVGAMLSILVTLAFNGLESDQSVIASSATARWTA